MGEAGPGPGPGPRETPEPEEEEAAAAPGGARGGRAGPRGGIRVLKVRRGPGPAPHRPLGDRSARWSLLAARRGGGELSQRGRRPWGAARLDLGGTAGRGRGLPVPVSELSGPARPVPVGLPPALVERSRGAAGGVGSPQPSGAAGLSGPGRPPGPGPPAACAEGLPAGPGRSSQPRPSREERRQRPAQRQPVMLWFGLPCRET